MWMEGEYQIECLVGLRIANKAREEIMLINDSDRER